MKKKYLTPEAEKIDFEALQRIAVLGHDETARSGTQTGGDHLEKSEFLGGDNSDIVTP